MSSREEAWSKDYREELFISLAEVTDVVKKLSSGKAPGDVGMVFTLTMDWWTRMLQNYDIPGLLLWASQSL